MCCYRAVLTERGYVNSYSPPRFRGFWMYNILFSHKKSPEGVGVYFSIFTRKFLQFVWGVSVQTKDGFPVMQTCLTVSVTSIIIVVEPHRCVCRCICLRLLYLCRCIKKTVTKSNSVKWYMWCMFIFCKMKNCITSS